MMKRVGLPIIFVLGLVLAPFPTSRAQSSEDTFSGAVDSYFAAVDAYYSGKSEEAMRGLRQALKIFQRDQCGKGEFMVHLSLAEIYGNEGKYDRAMAELEKALELKRLARDILGESLVQLRMGQLDADRSRFAEARKHLEEGLAGAKAMEDAHLRAIIGTSLAEVLTVNGELEKARALLEEALPVHTESRDDYHRALTLMRLADIEIIRNRYDKASELLSQAQKMISHEKFEALRHEILGRMAQVLRKQGRLEEARNELQQSHGFFEKARQRHELASTKTELASVMMKEGRVREALNTVQGASEELHRLQADYEGARSMVLQGRLLMKTGRLTEAMKTIEKGLAFFTEKNSPVGELSARIALAKVQVAQGQQSAALLNADRAMELAVRLQTPQGQADAMFVLGMVHAASGDHEKAVTEFGKALQLFQTLKNTSAEARCRIRRAQSLVAAGFPESAQSDIDALEKLPAAKSDLFVRGHIFLLKAAVADALGNGSLTVSELDKAQAILGKLSYPLVDASLLEWRAKPQIANRNYYAASDLLEKAEKIFTQSESPSGVIRCRAAQIAITLDRNYFRDAQSITRKSLKIPWQRGYGSQKRDPDSASLGARLACLRSRVKLASGDSNDARKEASKAREIAIELRNSSVSDESATLLARCYVAQQEYGKALELLQKVSCPVKWRVGHARAMSLVTQGKIEDALPVFDETIADLTERELGEGLRNVPPHRLRERELLYEDYVDALVAAARKLKSAKHLSTAWDVGQRLKMRRFVYLRSAVGTTLVPGVPRSVFGRINVMQADAANRVKRRAFPILNKQLGDKGTTDEREEGPGPYSQVKSFIKETSRKHPQLAALMFGNAPASSDVAARVKSHERYVSIIATRKHYHVFLVAGDGIKAAEDSSDAETIVKQADAVSKGISSPYYYKIDKRAAELWTALFGTLAPEISKGDSLIIETDARLTMFPFEALVPGGFPDSYQEQQTVPILLEKSTILRTTSAFRFLRSRTKPKPAPPSKLCIFARPQLPKESTDGSGEGTLLVSTWKRVLAGFDSQTGSEEADVFGKNAQVFAETRATRSNFLQGEAPRSPLIHVACPVLLPRTPAGKLLQPFVVFSPESNDPVTAFCGISDLANIALPADGVVFTWIGRTGDSTDEAFFLLLESFGLAGTGWIMVPLWEADRQGEADTVSFMTTFYGALKNGDSPGKALTKARQTLKPDSNRKNRCNSARMALY